MSACDRYRRDKPCEKKGERNERRFRRMGYARVVQGVQKIMTIRILWEYYISFGMAAQHKAEGDLDLRELTKEAENNMFLAKQAFYQQPEHNRRNR